MLTPQNFREKTFERAVFGGYDMGAVDNFLEEAANDYTALAKENSVLKSKMKVLVEKIEEYRTTEDSMRLTLLSAQKLCTQMEQETKAKADLTLAEANLEAERITREAHNQRINEEAKLLEAKKESTRYIENMRLACAKQLEFYEGLENYKMDMERSLDQHAAPVTESVEDTVRKIESSVARMEGPIEGDREIGRVVSDTAEIPAKSNEEPTRVLGSQQDKANSFWDNLQFGKQ